ncbi:MAG: F0F1 ATP synthase subunit B family protein [Thermoleophilia bacterium]
MEIDFFTLIAQIINFLVLVLLLRRFLYGPIVRTMDKREKLIADELEAAAHKEQEARREARLCHTELVELEDSRGEMLSRAQEEADGLKRQMINEARREVDASKARWSQALQKEKQTFLANLRQRAGEEIFAISRQAISDLADIELERQIINIFIERLRDLGEEECRGIAAAARRARGGATITTSFPLDHATRERLLDVVHERIAPDIELDFEESADLICGIELLAAGRKAAWSLQHYLETLDERLTLAFGAEAQDAGREVDQHE